TLDGMAARRRRLVASLALAAAGLTGCGGGGHESRAPLVKLDSLESGGWPVLASAPNGLTLRFIERTRFGIGIVLRNRSGRSVTILAAGTPEPVGALVHQIGTRLVPWNPPPCTGGARLPGVRVPPHLVRRRSARSRDDRAG